MFSKFWSWLKGLFTAVQNNPNLNLLATIGVKELLLAHPELGISVIAASQALVDGIDGKSIVSLTNISSLITAELASLKLNPGSQILVDALVTTYLPTVSTYVTSTSGGLVAQLAVLRQLAVLVNVSAGGTAK